MQRKILSISIMALLGLGAVSTTQAAVVPAGTILANQQQVTRNNGSDPATLDPQLAESNDAFNIILDSFVGAVALDSEGKVHPELAEKWDNQDNKVWTFHLRPGITWSNGQPITAQDFVYSWQRLADPKTASPYQSYISAIHILNGDAVMNGKLPPSALGVKALDAQTFQVTLSQPVSWFLQAAASPSFYPVNQQNVEKFGEKWTQPANIVVSGAFKPSKWVINERFVSERNPHYWNNASTVINKVTYLPIVEPSATLNRYQSGEIDITDTIPTVNFAQIKKTIPDQIKQTPLLGVYEYWFNLNKPPFNDQRVRMALNLAVDKSVITDKVLGMGQEPAWTLMPLHIGGETYQPTEIAQWTPAQRIAQAKKLLAEAGFSADKPLKAELLYNTQQDHQKIAIALSSMWKKNLGAQITLRNQEWKTLIQTQHNGDFQLIRQSWLADYDAPPTFLNNFMTGDTQNDGKYSNPNYDRLVNDAAEQTEPQKAKADYQQALDILSNDVPAIPLYYYVQNILVKPWVGGVFVSRLGFYKTQDMYIRQH
ncbi:oligopeptide ABC transporter substrate-binding protein OppA [Rosenbergiella australiborealis]|uniref:Oligopeptide ABC transporter substrate-binding protein OppA n=1 Tax=Rosenbergiella australiborealis TaxID=1544696 RepID=A0ABS5T3N0_9GAMM|nr:ABC transporter substrate-binding protein [Rosenbergiella australiborealis]MBT0726959.1 oligopeptide ABC transporter substrate-binding protein OppA [Rosenbergiella australiborealis]